MSSRVTALERRFAQRSRLDGHSRSARSDRCERLLSVTDMVPITGPLMYEPRRRRTGYRNHPFIGSISVTHVVWMTRR
jgi:hypothetical protein